MSEDGKVLSWADVVQRFERDHGPLWERRYYAWRGARTVRNYLSTVTTSFRRDRTSVEKDMERRLQEVADADEAQNIHDEWSRRDSDLAWDFPAFALETTFVAT